MFNNILQEFQIFPEVKTIAVGGPTSAKTTDNKSLLFISFLTRYSYKHKKKYC